MINITLQGSCTSVTELNNSGAQPPGYQASEFRLSGVGWDQKSQRRLLALISRIFDARNKDFDVLSLGWVTEVQIVSFGILVEWLSPRKGGGGF